MASLPNTCTGSDKNPYLLGPMYPRQSRGALKLEWGVYNATMGGHVDCFSTTLPCLVRHVGEGLGAQGSRQLRKRSEVLNPLPW